MTPPRNLTDSGLYAQAAQVFDDVLDEVAAVVARASSEQVRDILDRYKRATHELLRAHRIQVVDDCTRIVLEAELRQDRRITGLEEWAYGGTIEVQAVAPDWPDDPTGTDAGAHPRG